MLWSILTRHSHIHLHRRHPGSDKRKRRRIRHGALAESPQRRQGRFSPAHVQKSSHGGEGILGKSTAVRRHHDAFVQNEIKNLQLRSVHLPKRAALAIFSPLTSYLWGYSSVGRATGSQSVGHGFDSHYLHAKEASKRLPLLFSITPNSLVYQQPAINIPRPTPYYLLPTSYGLPSTSY